MFQVFVDLPVARCDLSLVGGVVIANRGVVAYVQVEGSRPRRSFNGFLGQPRKFVDHVGCSLFAKGRSVAFSHSTATELVERKLAEAKR